MGVGGPDGGRADAGVSNGGGSGLDGPGDDEGPDVFNDVLVRAFEAVRNDKWLMHDLRHGGVPWKRIARAIEENLPNLWNKREDIAYQNVRRFLNETFGEGNWAAERRPRKDGQGQTAYVFIPAKTPEQELDG